MKVLIADDDRATRRLLETTLRRWDYDVVVTEDGLAAWEQLQAPAAPRLAILDWIMPGLDGPSLCRKIRQQVADQPPYLFLLTGRNAKGDIVQGLEGGADDYLIKPFDPEELRARLQVACRILELQQLLADRVHELEGALARVKQLHGLLPLCAWCHKVRNDDNYWQQLEAYVCEHTEARFTHGICPDCLSAVTARTTARKVV